MTTATIAGDLAVEADRARLLEWLASMLINGMIPVELDDSLSGRCFLIDRGKVVRLAPEAWEAMRQFREARGIPERTTDPAELN